MTVPTTTVIQSASSWLPQTQTWLYQQVRHLPDDIVSHIVCEKTENLDQFDLPHIHSLRAAPRWRYLWDKGLRRLGVRHHLGFMVQQAKRHHAQLLHSHFGPVGWQDIGVARQARLKHLVTFYGLDLSYAPQKDPRWYGRYRDLFAHIDRVLCEGPFMGQTLIALGCPPDKVRVHHLGVSVAEIPYQPRRWEPGSPLRVLLAAAFREKKGLPDALDALGRIRHEVTLDITIIGDANQEPRSQAEKQKILAMIERHQLQDKVRMLGYQPYSHLFSEAAAHHLFLSPSVTASDGDTEGGAPVSLIEMAASGMALVSTTHCDIPEVIRHGSTGLLAPERDPAALADHLRWFLAHPDEWRPMLDAGRQHIEQEYDARRQGERLAALYRELAR